MIAKVTNYNIDIIADEGVFIEFQLKYPDNTQETKTIEISLPMITEIFNSINSP